LEFVSTSTFRESLKLLMKRDDSGYKSCCTDLCNELKNASFDDIYSRHFLVRESGDIRIIKLRIQNSYLNVSSAAGYRLIILCNRKIGHIAFLEIYPKKGKHSKSNLTKYEFKDIVNKYGAELKAGQLVAHDINNELKEPEKKKTPKSSNS
jgi:hypothetical protein